MAKAKTLNTETQKTIQLLITTLSIMIATLTIVSLVTTNKTAEKGYSLEQNKLKNEELRSDNLNLTTKLTQATSFTKLRQNNEIEKMQAIEDKNYVTNKDNSVY